MTLEIFGDDRSFLRGSRRRLASSRAAVTVVDLFSGCGGLSLGVDAAAAHLGLSMDLKLAAECDPRIADTFVRNFHIDSRRLVDDVGGCFDGRFGARPTRAESVALEMVGRRLDFLIGGPPCQGHSSLNNHTRNDDPKNLLYMRMVRAAEVLRPRVLIIENVPSVRRDANNVLRRAERALRKLEYEVSTAVVALADIGVPQRRERHVLVATDGGCADMTAAISAARVKQVRDLRWAIGDLVHRAGDPFDGASVLSRANQRRAEYLLRKDQYDLPNHQRPPCQHGPHKYKSMYGRLRWDEPAQTITSGFGSPGQGRYLHPTQPRTLTPHEAARLQFFPDWFDFGGITERKRLARAIGNAVPPKLSFVLAHQYLSTLIALPRAMQRYAEARDETGGRRKQLALL